MYHNFITVQLEFGCCNETNVCLVAKLVLEVCISVISVYVK